MFDHDREITRGFDDYTDEDILRAECMEAFAEGRSHHCKYDREEEDNTHAEGEESIGDKLNSSLQAINKEYNRLGELLN